MTDRPEESTAIAPAVLPLFVYGTLLDPEFVSHLLERQVVAEPARLVGFELLQLPGLPYPVVCEAPEEELPGRVYRHLLTADFERLDAYEGVAERLYRRIIADILTGEADGRPAVRERAFVYVPTGETLRRYG